MAAELALPHRRRRDPFDDPGLDPRQLDEAMAQARRAPRDDPDPDPDPPVAAAQSATDDRQHHCSRIQVNSTVRRTRPSAPPSATSSAPGRSTVPGVGEGAPGRRSRARNRIRHRGVGGIDTRRGPRAAPVRARCWPRRADSTGPGRLRPEPDDVRRAIREGREGNLVIFVVDASGSMAARDRMAAVSGATLSLLRDAYQRRDKVAVITFRSTEARCCCRRRRRCTSPAAGWRGSTPAARRRWRRGCWPRATWSCGRRCATARGAAWWWCSPTGGPPAGRTRWAAARVAAARLVAEGAACGRRRLRNILCATGFGRAAGRASSVRRRCGWRSCAPTI